MHTHTLQMLSIERGWRRQWIKEMMGYCFRGTRGSAGFWWCPILRLVRSLELPIEEARNGPHEGQWKGRRASSAELSAAACQGVPKGPTARRPTPPAPYLWDSWSTCTEPPPCFRARRRASSWPGAGRAAAEARARSPPPRPGGPQRPGRRAPRAARRPRGADIPSGNGAATPGTTPAPAALPLRHRSTSPGAALLHACLPSPRASRLVFIDPDVAFTSWMKGAGSAHETPPRRRGCGTAACPRLRRAPSWGGSAVPRSPAAPHPDISSPQQTNSRGILHKAAAEGLASFGSFSIKSRVAHFLELPVLTLRGSRKLPPRKSWSNGKAL
jgi:hypothetical protein